MLDTIFIGMSGLNAYSQGLRVIADNTANINTPGFKGSNLQFGSLVQSQGANAGNLGQGVTTYDTTLDFHQGELRSTQNTLDLAIDGQGLFILQQADGSRIYTRDGEFKFDANGDLVTRSNGQKVLAWKDGGTLSPISISNLRTSAPKATSKLVFQGNLSVASAGTPSTTTPAYTLGDVKVRDSAGAQHSLTIQFFNVTAVLPGEVRWDVKVMDGTQEVATKTLSFLGNQLDPSTATPSFTYTPPNLGAMEIKLDFGTDVTSFLGSNQSSLKLSSQDDYASGNLTDVTFGADGTLSYKYSNGQTTTGARLALARFDSVDNIRAAGNNTFVPVDASRWETGSAQSGAFGTIKSSQIEVANVDLSTEFSELVIMQRGYQASSQVVTTANEMIQELFSMKGR